MNLVELKQILESIDFPVAYSHFTPSPNNPVPKPPYICYLVSHSTNIMADDEVYKEIDNVQIELYTLKKDLAAEKIVKDLLKANKLPYETREAFIVSEKLYQKIYEVRLI
jgi:hypothetical protein